jgi:hypothetical protein
MSLTTEPGNRPWEQPPRFTEVGEVVDFYSDKLTAVEAMDEVATLLEEGMPILNIANVLVKNGLMNGVHSIDTGFLVTPVIVELIKSIATIYDVGYIETSDDMQEMSELPDKLVKEVLAEAKTKMKEVVKEPTSRGLMSKGK